MQIYTFRHPELGIIFIKARSREEAQRAGQSALGSNLTFQASGATIADARSAAGSRLYGVRDDGALITSGTSGITNGQDNPNMVDFFTNLTSADSSLNVPPSVIIPPDDSTVSGPGQEALAPAGQTEFRFQQFLRGLQDRGVGTTGLAGRARRQAFQPLQARFLAEQALNEIPGVTDPAPRTFAQFTQSQPLAGANANLAAGNLFTRALGAGRGVDPRGGGFEGFSPLQQELLNPQNAFQAQRLGDLALASARGRLGASAEFLPDAASLFAQFGAQGNNALSFGDFLNQKIFGQQRIG
jgi:hypothetical protein